MVSYSIRMASRFEPTAELKLKDNILLFVLSESGINIAVALPNLADRAYKINTSFIRLKLHN